MNLDNAEGVRTGNAMASLCRTTYRFGTSTIEVASDDPEAARWLEEFLSPWFSIEAPDKAGLHVTMTGSWERFSMLARREAEANAQPLPCFGLDSAVAACPGWTEPDGTLVASDKEFGCYYRLGNDRVEVISRPKDRSARIGLMRVVRELATVCASARMEMLDLHAAGFFFRGRSILLAGDKKAGKTTLLAHALTSSRASLLANDRVMIGGRPPEAHGIPTVVSVRDQTERAFSALGHGLPRRAVLLHRGELASADFAGTDAADRFVLSPAQFARQLDSRVRASAPAGLILFPEISPSLDTWSLEPLDPGQAAGRLRKSLYGCRVSPRSETVFQKITQTYPGSTVRDSLVDLLAAEVPAMRCLLGKNAYGESADTWLEALPIEEGTATP